MSLLTKKFGNQMEFYLLVNKLDLCYNRRKLQENISLLEGKMNFSKKFFISAETGFGLEELKKFFIENSKNENWMFPAGISHTQTELELIQEKFRSIIFN